MSIMEFVAIVGLMGPACIIHLVLPGNAPPDLHERQAPYSRNRLLFLASPMRSCYTFFYREERLRMISALAPGERSGE